MDQPISRDVVNLCGAAAMRRKKLAIPGGWDSGDTKRYQVSGGNAGSTMFQYHQSPGGCQFADWRAYFRRV